MNTQLPTNLSNNKSWLYQLATELSMNGETIETALSKIGVLPNKTEWKNWLTLITLSLGSSLFLAGVIFFFAYNWEHLHRFTRFAILGGATIISAIFAFKLGLENLTGKIAITAASVFTGTLLATFGMVYQTGADSYQLFASWAFLILAWTIAARFQPLWFIWFVIVNIALVRWISISHFGRFSGYDTFRDLMIIPVLLNATILILREKTTFIHLSPETARWLPRLIAAFLLSMLTSIPIEGLFEHALGNIWGILFALYLITLAAMSYYYFYSRQDLLMLVFVMVSVIFVITAIIIKSLSFRNFDLGLLFFVGLSIIAQVTIATKLIAFISKHWQSQEAK